MGQPGRAKGVAGGANGAARVAGAATAACTSSRVIVPSGPVPARPARSTPRSLASFRTGGLAAGRVPARPFPPGAAVSAPPGTGADGGAAVPAGPETGADEGAAVPAGEGRPGFRCRRFVVPSFTPYPTSTACRSIFGAGLPSIPGSKACCSGDSAPAGRGAAGVRVGVAAAGALTAGRPAPATGVSLVPPETSTAMIGVPTLTVAPSSTSSPATTPSYGDGSSTTALAVSISTMTWLTLTGSPGLTCQATMSASVSPSPTSGSLNCFTSDI